MFLTLMGEIMRLVRINKYLADAGVCSRRKADKYILDGRVKVNGSNLIHLGQKIDARKDVIEFDGKVLNKDKQKVFLALNKPVGVICSNDDQFGRPIVLDFVKDVKERIFHVGRLDCDTSGLILLTNDGYVSQKLMHPSKTIYKTYIARLEGFYLKKQLKRFEVGLEIDGRLTAPAKIRVIKKHCQSFLVEIKIYEGRNRQIRKMCEQIGYKVLDLKRIAIGEIRLGNLCVGEYRFLNNEEINYLQSM